VAAPTEVPGTPDHAKAVHDKGSDHAKREKRVSWLAIAQFQLSESAGGATGVEGKA